MASKIILVTGGNRGIGLGVVQSILHSSLEHTIIIASREKSNAEETIQQLREKTPKASLYPLTLDVADDESTQAAVAEVQEKFGKLDVLINNAGIAMREDTPPDARATWAKILDVNVTSVRLVSQAFLPLLKAAEDPRVINMSSARGSFDRVIAGQDPDRFIMPYSCSKACLNFMTLQMARENPEILFYAVSPGHCKTAFNGFRGVKDPVDGGKVAAELALAEKGRYQAGFWEYENDGMQMVGW